MCSLRASAPVCALHLCCPALSTLQADLRLARQLCEGASIVVADEAHTIKNPSSRMSIAMCRIKTRARLALTGYPLQNNLEEYYTMIQWVRGCDIHIHTYTQGGRRGQAGRLGASWGGMGGR